MARPKKCRRICREPAYDSFLPDMCGIPEQVVLSVEEFEVLRLMDLEKQTQEQCAKQMGIARTTVTDMYEQARYKVADCLVNGKKLHITGGSYRICDGSSDVCQQKQCRRSRRRIEEFHLSEKGEQQMRVAVTYENGTIFQHFGHTEEFKIYDIEDNQVVTTQVVATMGSGHGALVGFLAEHHVDALICGGIGGGAQIALAEAGIQLYGGVTGAADEAVAALLAGNLGYNPDVHCDHHDQEHGDGAHACGSHGCGSHSCH